MKIIITFFVFYTLLLVTLHNENTKIVDSSDKKEKIKFIKCPFFNIITYL